MNRGEERPRNDRPHVQHVRADWLLHRGRQQPRPQLIPAVLRAQHLPEDYVRVLRKSWALILAVTIVGIGLGVGLTLLTTKVYQASTQVFVSSNSTDTSTATAPSSTHCPAPW